MSKLGQSGIASILVLVLLVGGLGSGLYLSQNTQIFNPQAARLKAPAQRTRTPIYPSPSPVQSSRPSPSATPSPVIIPDIKIIFPDTGPVETQFTIRGIGFGINEGSVSFYNLAGLNVGGSP